MRHDGAALRVLYIGGTGTISTSCVRLSVESGMSVFVLNRGNNSAARQLPEGVIWLTGEVTDDTSVMAAIGDQRFDAVVNFLSYDADDVRRMVAMFGSHQLRVHLRQAGAAVTDHRVDAHCTEPGA
jgi:nucleoside-diphosphate-sugar epimerase